MKKKLFIIILILVLCCTFVAGCGSNKVKAKKIKENGYSITLLSDFEKTAVDGFDTFYQNDKVAFTSLKEEFNKLEAVSLNKNSSLEDYGNLVIKNNARDSKLEKNTKNDYAYFTYEDTVDNKDFFYYTVVKKGKDAFWLFNFYCLKSDKDKQLSNIEKWAASIKLD